MINIYFNFLFLIGRMEIKVNIVFMVLILVHCEERTVHLLHVFLPTEELDSTVCRRSLGPIYVVTYCI